MKSKIRVELEQLLHEGEHFGEIEKSPEAWERQIRHLIDKYLGPRLESPTNAHSQGYYDFIFSDSHSAKLAILGTVLAFHTPDNTVQHLPNAEFNSTYEKNRLFNFDRTKGIIEFTATLIVVITGIVAFVKWLL